MESPRNRTEILEGERVLLVPYLPEHVPKYHSWMQALDLLEQTASEKLSLQEQYEMQKSWDSDPNKHIFIILDRTCPDEPDHSTTGGGMAGDVNLFLRDDIGENSAEIEVMIAEPKSRGKGLATEAVKVDIHSHAVRDAI